ncbi:MAG: hypothetical protein ACKOC5_04355 [Chloroflexota bacterium]
MTRTTEPPAGSSTAAAADKNRPARVFHPLLFAAYPVLSLLAYNIEEIKVQDGLRALLAVLLLGGLAHLALARLLKNPYRSGVIVTLGLVLFFSYGQVYNLLNRLDLPGIALGRHRLLLPLWGLLFAAGLAWALRRKGRFPMLTYALNAMGLFLVVFPLLQIGLYAARSAGENARPTAAEVQLAQLALPAGQPAPDIYYIILDAYGRQDYLKRSVKLDNRPFLKELQELGFYVARCSQSNYAQTRLSLASALNMDYLDRLNENFRPGSTTRVGLTHLIHSSAVRGELEAAGYTSIAFETGFKGTQWEDAGVYISPSANQGLLGGLFGGLSGFEQLLLRTSAGLALINSRPGPQAGLGSTMNNSNRAHYDLIRYNLEQLEALPQRPGGPKLVFAHLVIPHPPYVFGPDGQYLDFDQQDDPGYRDQITYINSRILPLLKRIIETSTVPPVIILQGDHGAILAPPNDRMSILNAYYLPGIDPAQLRDDISPVNSFRLVFNRYFGASYDYLPDRALFSVYNKPYEFSLVENDLQSCRK